MTCSENEFSLPVKRIIGIPERMQGPVLDLYTNKNGLHVWLHSKPGKGT